jgi:uncharacterized protein YpbB
VQKKQEKILKALQEQADFLEATRIHHVYLGHRAEDLEIVRAHVAFTDLLVQAISRCHDLIHKYYPVTK